MTDKVDTFLEHRGIKGMKWGHKSTSNPKTSVDAKKSKARKDLAITVGLGAAMVASMALGSIRTSNIKSAQIQRQHDLSDFMGLPMSSVKLNYNASNNRWE